MNTSLILFVLSAAVCIVGLVAFWREKIAIFICCLVIAVIGVTLGFRASFSDNKRMEETIQRAGPALINQLLSGEAIPMEDNDFPKMMSRLAKKLNYPPNVVEELKKPANYRINFMSFPSLPPDTNGVPTATNRLPKVPMNHEFPGFQSSTMCQIQSHSHSP